MRLAGIKKAYIILRSGKWDIPAYFGNGAAIGVDLGYLIAGLPYGVPYTLDVAYPFVQNSVITLGFPDILFEPENAFERLLGHLSQSQADVVIGASRFDQPHRGGMIDFDDTGRVTQVIEKPAVSDLKYSWYVAVWTPVFTQFIHDYLIALEARYQASHNEQEIPDRREISMADVIQAGIDAGLTVEVELMPTGSYIDIGTPTDLVKKMHYLVSEASQFFLDQES